MKLQSLNVFPIKGARGNARASIEITPLGLADDRRWMIVDAAARFVTQRELARLAVVGAEISGDGLVLTFPGEAAITVVRPSGIDRMMVGVWGDEVDAALAAHEVNATLSHWLGRPVRLAFFDDVAARRVSPEWVAAPSPVAFADGFPILVATSASLDALNRDLIAHGRDIVPMDRFRPNIVVDGAEPFAEDGWAAIEIGGVVFDLVKPCARCVVTTVDQRRGERSGKEPLATLARLHRSADKRAPGALFGWNAVPRGDGRLRVGDVVTILQHRDRWPIA